VAGIILRRLYNEGTDVAPGQALFQIDPAPLEADLHVAEATLARAQADATNAALTAKRYRELAAKKLLSFQDLDTALAEERTTAADVKGALAKVEKARLDLSYTKVTAPIGGRASQALVTEGALVGQDEATQLTTVEQLDPIYVNFSLSVTELQSVEITPKGEPSASVELILPDGTEYAHRGTLDYSGSTVDPGTGVVSLRAVVPNPERRLLPGMFVNLDLTVGRLPNAFSLPQASLSRDPQGPYLLVVDNTGKVEQRRVTTHGMTRRDWIVTGPLAEGEQVILEGLQKVQPGVMAKAVPAATPEG
jgi:membrane fusion protein (multidrug efflux system)